MMHDSLIEDVAAISRIEAIPAILDIVCRNTGLRFAAVARVTESRWLACAVHDGIGLGLRAGGELELSTTICDEIRASGKPVVIDHVALDPMFRDHHTARMYGFQSYISVPIVRLDGAFFGTLCALDPLPGKLKDPAVIAMFEAFAQLIGSQIHFEDRLSYSEAALAAARTNATDRERFIAALGHDLRNPLASVEAGVKMLRKDPPREKADFILEHMLLSCQRMFGMIHDVLDFARGRLGDGLSIKPSRGDNLAQALVHAVEELTVHGREVAVDVVLDDPVVCDVPRVSQLVSNLVGNALTHGDPAQPVKVSARTQRGALVVTVSNGGKPIPAERIPHLFQPFAGQSPAGVRDGLGLGLFIANEIAKAHGGEIAVVSNERQTTFTFTMPCGQLPARPAT